jgi:3-isopropylmalate/(R)-2-methylmalate dehydratase large subunit
MHLRQTRPWLPHGTLVVVTLGGGLGVAATGTWTLREVHPTRANPNARHSSRRTPIPDASPGEYDGWDQEQDCAMGMTLAEKILARASGREEVSPGQSVVASVDLAVSNENAGLVRKSFREIGAPRIWDPARVVIVFDHGVPAGSERTAATHKDVRELVREYGIHHFYDLGRGGICHQVLAENGHVLPGMVVVGSGSHTIVHGAFGAFSTGISTSEMAGVWADGRLRFKVPSTLRVEVTGEFRPWISAKDLILYVIGKLGAMRHAVEFDGATVRRLSIASRMVLANLSAEIGAPVAFTPVDETLLAFVARTSGIPLGMSPAFEPDPDASYEKVFHVNVTSDVFEPQVACPHSVNQVLPISKLLDVRIDQAVLGGCVNGRLEDLELASRILAGRAVHPHTRFLVIPASQRVYLDAAHHGYLQTLVAAGAIVNPPGCGPCVGVHPASLAAGEICITTTNHNSIGCMGSKESKIYIASPAVVAASAVAGRIAHPGAVTEDAAA